MYEECERRTDMTKFSDEYDQKTRPHYMMLILLSEKGILLFVSVAYLSLSFEWSLQSITVNDVHNYISTNLH